MVFKRLLYPVLFAVLLWAVLLPAEEAVKTAPAEGQIDKQLKLNKEALLGGSMDAATLMLEDSNPATRKILLDVLNEKSNLAACEAICKAFINVKIGQNKIDNKQDFIGPLLNYLAFSAAERAGLVAEATLLFDYDEISEPIEKMVSDASMSSKSRINIITALKRRPAKKAILKLMELLEDEDKLVAAEAEKALKSIGFAVGDDSEKRQRNIQELRKKNNDEFLQDWITRQQESVQRLIRDNIYWQKQTIAAHNKAYDSISDDAERGEYIAANLKSEKPQLRLWALEKIAEWRKGTNTNLPENLGPILIAMISDEDRNVRLHTARLLSIMGKLDCAKQLLAQIKVEEDSEVKMDFFIALGGACYQTKISPEIKIETLDMAAGYLGSDDSQQAQRGADVMKNLLEQDGLPKDKIDAYLKMLAERFNKPGDDQLRSELLGAMSGICSQSVYKKEAIQIYRPLFKESLGNEAEIVREAAVDGLIYIDRAEALKELRKDLINDSSQRVVESIIKLANEVGSDEDLEWLSGKLSAKNHGNIAWQAMLKIFKGSKLDVLDQWFDEIFVVNGLAVSDEQKLSFLDILEVKASGEKKLDIVAKVRPLQADIYEKLGNYEQAGKYIELLIASADNDAKKKALTDRLFGLYLKAGNLKAVNDVVAKALQSRDLGADDSLVVQLDKYFGDVNYSQFCKELLESFKKIKINQENPKPLWSKKLGLWSQGVNSGKKEVKP